MSEPETKDKGHGNDAGRSVEEPPGVPGLADLIEVINVMGSAPPGVRPKLDQALLNRVKATPLRPALKALEPIYMKLGSTTESVPEQTQRQETHQRPPQPVSPPGPDPSSSQPLQPTPTPVSGSQSSQQPAPATSAPDAIELKNVEAGLKSLSSRLDSVSQVFTDVATRGDVASNFQTLNNNLRQADSETLNAVKASANASKTQIETVDKKVKVRRVVQLNRWLNEGGQLSLISGKLDPALSTLAQEVRRLQASLLDDAKTERTRLEAKNKELEKEIQELQQVIHDTRAELLPVEVVSKIALEGTFPNEPDKKGGHVGNSSAASGSNLLQTAKRVRANTSSLVAKCRTLLGFINRNGEAESDVPELGKEGEWGRCAEHLRASHSKLLNAVKEKEESDQKLQCVGFVIEQIRKGHYTEKEWESDANWDSFVALVKKSPGGFESIQLLAEDLSRLTAQATTTTVPNGPASSSGGSNASTVKPPQRRSQAPAPRVESVAPLTSTPAVTAPGSPLVTTNPIPNPIPPRREPDVR
ncbi:hypothetical protein FRC01_002256 [Tulasnella sp. 417]|nr:hypothetical protein FRC01_002256 [Tulasnella sp. 417]